MCPFFPRRRGGTSVPHMLFAGASAIDTPSVGGALAFAVNGSPSATWWNGGSALFLLYISIVYYICRKEV